MNPVYVMITLVLLYWLLPVSYFAWDLLFIFYCVRVLHERLTLQEPLLWHISDILISFGNKNIAFEDRYLKRKL